MFEPTAAQLEIIEAAKATVEGISHAVSEKAFFWENVILFNLCFQY